MSFKPSTQPKRQQQSSGGGPPAWLVFILGVAVVFGVYYIWLGVSDFIESGALAIDESTEQAVVVDTATAEQAQQQATLTAFPTNTPQPECLDFTVIAGPSAILREAPTTSAGIVDSIPQGETLCVIRRQDETDWYLVDSNPVTRRIEAAFVREDLVEATNPTLTPSNTFTPAPTVTDVPSETPSITPSPRPTDTPDPDATETPTPTPTPSPTSAIQSA